MESRLYVSLVAVINIFADFLIGFLSGHHSLELMPTISEVLTQIKNVEKWSKPTRPPFSINFFAMRPLIRKEPKGVVLIISPFNYPVFLTLGPLVCTFLRLGGCLAKELSYIFIFTGGSYRCWQCSRYQSRRVHPCDDCPDDRVG